MSLKRSRRLRKASDRSPNRVQAKAPLFNIAEFVAVFLSKIVRMGVKTFREVAFDSKVIGVIDVH